MAYSANNPYVKNGQPAGSKMHADMWEASNATAQGKIAGEAQASAAAKAAADAAKTLQDNVQRQQISKEYQERYSGFAPKPIESVAKAGPVELQKTLAMRESGLQGFQAPELEAMRSQIAAGQQAAQNQRERALQAALARQGIRGGAAASLQAQQAQQASREKAGMDIEMMLKQAQRQREALGEYETGVTGAYNLAQQQQFQQLATKLAAEQAAQAELARQSGLKEAEMYQTGQQQVADSSGGGCCVILVISSSVLGGINSAQAQEIISFSKGSIEEKEFILEKYKNNNEIIETISIIQDVRNVRDATALKAKRGYYKFSEKVIPIIKNNSLAINLGKKVLVNPIRSIKTNPKSFNAFIGKSWIRFWSLIGGSIPFKRQNGEIV